MVTDKKLDLVKRSLKNIQCFLKIIEKIQTIKSWRARSVL